MGGKAPGFFLMIGRDGSRLKIAPADCSKNACIGIHYSSYYFRTATMEKICPE